MASSSVGHLSLPLSRFVVMQGNIVDTMVKRPLKRMSEGECSLATRVNMGMGRLIAGRENEGIPYKGSWLAREGVNGTWCGGGARWALQATHFGVRA